LEEVEAVPAVLQEPTLAEHKEKVLQLMVEKAVAEAQLFKDGYPHHQQL
jgi:hypothetical protein